MSQMNVNVIFIVIYKKKFEQSGSNTQCIVYRLRETTSGNTV